MKYGMIAPNVSSTKTVRCVFIIDPEGRIRAILTYPLTNGRNISEILRLVEAIQISDKENVATPANWIPGQPVVVPAPTTYAGLMERVKNPNEYMCINWYLCFKNSINPNMINTNNMFCNEHMRIDDKSDIKVEQQETSKSNSQY